MILKECGECGKMFERTGRQLLCSGPCRQAAQLRRQEEYKCKLPTIHNRRCGVKEKRDPLHLDLLGAALRLWEAKQGAGLSNLTRSHPWAHRHTVSF